MLWMVHSRVAPAVVGALDGDPPVATAGDGALPRWAVAGDGSRLPGVAREQDCGDEAPASIRNSG
jgi:hypothetical protein